MRTPIAILVLAACGSRTPSPPPEPPPPPGFVALRSPADFASIADAGTRSVALFTEAARVIEHPRCLNCHPADRIPTQGDDLHPHVPLMQAGAEGHGPAGMHCRTCHQAANVTTYSDDGGAAAIASLPGHSHWMLAPASMAWQGKTTAEICEQIKDPARNGGRTLAQIHEHMAKDALVGWAWQPGAGRTPAPGTQAQFGALLEAWIATGARCPRAP
jgi:hypothetical protein